MAKFTPVEIDGHRFTFRRIPADECLDRLAELQSITVGSINVDFGKDDGTGKEIRDVQIGAAIASAISSLSKTLDRARFARVRGLLLDPEYTSIGEGAEAAKLTSTALAKHDVEAPTLAKLMVEGFKVNYLPVFISAAGNFGKDLDLTPAGLLSALSTLKSSG